MEDHPKAEESVPMTREETEALISGVTRQLEARIEAAARTGAAREETLSAREKTLDRREMAVKTAEALRARGLPEALAEVLPFSGEEDMTRAVGDIERAFRQCVQAGVEERLQGDAPKTAPAKPLSDLTDKEYYAAISRR